MTNDSFFFFPENASQGVSLSPTLTIIGPNFNSHLSQYKLALKHSLFLQYPSVLRSSRHGTIECPRARQITAFAKIEVGVTFHTNAHRNLVSQRDLHPYDSHLTEHMTKINNEEAPPNKLTTANKVHNEQNITVPYTW